MTKSLVSVLLYFYFLFRKGVKSDYPCRVSPYFALRNTKGLRKVNLGSAFIGRDVRIADGCCFYENPILFGNVQVGRYTSINGPGTRICAGNNGVVIGSFCSIASNVVIQEYNHRTDSASTYNVISGVLNQTANMSVSKGPIHIEDGVWLGSNTVVLSGVTIGRGAVIGAGSVVVKDIPPYAIAVGNPAKVVKYRFSDEAIKEVEDSKWWLWNENQIRENSSFFERIFK